MAGGPVDPWRVSVIFELADPGDTTSPGTTLADAATVHDFIVANGLWGVNFWRNYATVGGDCSTLVNRKIACIAFGECD